MTESFRIGHATKKDMNLLADSIENFLDFTENIIIYRNDLDEDAIERLKKGRSFVRKKMIKKLRNGDKDLFKDEDEWTYLN